MKKFAWIIALLLMVAPFAGCKKDNEPNPQEQQDKDKSSDPGASTDPDTSTDPDPSIDPDASNDPGLPLENLIVSLPQIDYTQDGNGVWRARVTFTIVTETSEIYFACGKDAALDDEQIIAKYKPIRVDDNGNGGWEYTIPELMPAFQTINYKMVARKGETVLSSSSSFDTFYSSEFAKTIYIEADEASAIVYKDGFSLTMVKDSYLFDNQEGGYKVTAKVSAPGNWDGNNKKYIVPDGKYELDGINYAAEFQTIIPGVGPYAASGAATLEISSNKMLGTWEIAITFNTEYDDWNQFKRVSQVVFTLYDKPMDVNSESFSADMYPMTGSVNFNPDSPEQGGNHAAILTRSHLSAYKVLIWSVQDTSSDSRYIDFLYVPLVIPLDFVPGESSWSSLNGTYTTPEEGFTRYSPFQAAVPYLNVFQQAVNTGLSYSRYDKEKWNAMDPNATSWEHTLAMMEASVQSAFPASSSQVAKLTASSDGAWIQIEVDFKDVNTPYHVRCTSVIMTDKIATTE